MNFVSLACPDFSGSLSKAVHPEFIFAQLTHLRQAQIDIVIMGKFEKFNDKYQLFIAQRPHSTPTMVEHRISLNL